MKGLKAQNALEYLTTYSWSAIILAVVLGAMVYLGIFNPFLPVSPYCTFPMDMKCYAFGINTTGSFLLDFGQQSGHPVSVTHVRCTQNLDVELNDSDLLPEPVTIISGSHGLVANGSKKCTSVLNGAIFDAYGSVGNVYRGNVYIQYTETDTGFVHVVAGDLLMKYDEIVMEMPS